MDRQRSDRLGHRPRLPRTRGDGPSRRIGISWAEAASPHTRGWTLRIALRRGGHVGFPAHAGMDPVPRARRCWPWRLPRTRGDGPPPGPRGRTRARLPRTRGDGPVCALGTAVMRKASPHTRGWTLHRAVDDDGDPGFPAHAGMDRCRSARPRTGTWLPRTRGDGPHRRGRRHRERPASPHTRGWTLAVTEQIAGVAGFPAHAGMDPGPGRRDPQPAGLPRTRGDGPFQYYTAPVADAASPHTRGWTRPGVPGHVAGDGFPAHAGMDPAPVGRGPRGVRLPRTRGDGPCAGRPRPSRRPASPHTRGWT